MTAQSEVPVDARAADDVPLREILREDFRTYQRDLSAPGFWALAVHRMGRRVARLDARARSKRPLRALHGLLATGVDWLWGIQLPVHTYVGRRVHIWHFGSLLLNARSIGNDVHIRHDTTMGAMRAALEGRPEALPVIEDGVDIGSGACILGNVVIGRGGRVGANTVVVEPVAAGATVFGVPSRVIPT